MKVELVAGGFVDFPTTDEIARHVGGIHQKLDSLKERMRPIYRNIVAAGVLGSGAFTDVTLPLKPAEGRLWNVVYSGVFGSDGHTTVTGVTAVEVYAGDEQTASQADQYDLFTAVPAKNWYSSKVIWVGSQSDVFVRVYGGTAGSQIQFVVRVMDYPDAAVESGGVPPLGGLGA